MKSFNLFIILIALFLTSCVQSAKKQDDILIVDFNQKQNADVSNDMLETDFVKLETNENCLIHKNIRQIESFDNKIFILSGGESSSLLVFDRSGKFITSTGRMGNGPGEYIIVTSFSIDRRRNIISVMDAAQKKILNYSTENYEFVSEYRIPNQTCLCFEYLDEDKIVWNNIGVGEDNAEWNYTVTDIDQKYINRYVKKEFITGYHTGPLKNLYQYNDGLYAYPAYQSVSLVYRLTENGAVPVYQLQFGKHSLPSIDYLKGISAKNANFLVTLGQSDYIYTFSVFETEKTLYACYLISGTWHVGIYSKSDGKTYCYTVKKFQDILKTGSAEKILGVINDYAVVALHPFELIEMKENGYKFPQKLQDLLNESKDDDNSILCLFKFKD
jgi:hypothetical protein